MTDPGTIFQRTHTGREEIHNKSHGLTQSERLVLIMVDGVSSCREIRSKLPVLTDERFERALQKLQAKELVLEVFMPLEGQSPEELERAVVDRFLQQDPMDPVTVILRDPEEELGMIGQFPPVPSAPESSHFSESNLSPTRFATDPVQNAAPSVQPQREEFPALMVPAPVPSRAGMVEPALDAYDVQLADSLAAELKARRALKPSPVPAHAERVSLPEPLTLQETQEVSPFVAVHWGYWLIVSGLSFILGFVLARVTS